MSRGRIAYCRTMQADAIGGLLAFELGLWWRDFTGDYRRFRVMASTAYTATSDSRPRSADYYVEMM